jgi:hypothetical protein
VDRVVVFVCPHGALKSRLAAAFFNHAAPAGWRATSAGLQPQEAVSTAALALAAGTDVADLVDRDPPRSLTGLLAADRLVGIDCDVPGGIRWHLHHSQAGEPMSDELRAAATDLAKALADA